MIDFKLNVKGNFSSAAVMKQINYGTAVALTKTAKSIQQGIQYEAKKVFTIRKEWLDQKTPVGIKVKPARPNDLKAEVYSNAYFLPLQDTGGTKLPYKNWIAIPTKNVRPNDKALIPKALLPHNLKNAFIVTTKQGVTLLCVRGAVGLNTRGQQRLLGKRATKAAGRSMLVMYVLVKQARIKETGVFMKTANYYAERWLAVHIQREVQYALDNIREVK